ncbi:hypothetical protein Esti_001047 [Eimeria stiedai]
MERLKFQVLLVSTTWQQQQLQQEVAAAATHPQRGPQQGGGVGPQAQQAAAAAATVAASAARATAAASAATALRLCLRHLCCYEETQKETAKETEVILNQVKDRRYLEGDYLQTLLSRPDLQLRCLSAFNLRILQQHSRLEALHAQLQQIVEGLQRATEACRQVAVNAAAAAHPAPVAAGPAAAAAEAAFAADSAGLLETIAAAYTRQVALQQRLLLMLHELQCTDGRELQRVLLLFQLRPCEYPLHRSGCVAAAKASLREHLERGKQKLTLEHLAAKSREGREAG